MVTLRVVGSVKAPWQPLWLWSITFPFCTCSSRLQEVLIPNTWNICIKAALPVSLFVWGQQTVLFLMSREYFRCKIQVPSAKHPCTCCLSSPTHWRADSQDALGQLLTGTTLETSLAFIHLPFIGPPRVSCQDGGGDGEGQGVGKKSVVRGGRGGRVCLVGFHAFSRGWSIPAGQWYSTIITFTIQRQRRAHAQQDHVSSSVCVRACALFCPY